MQAKRIQVNEQNIGAGASVIVFLVVPDDPREQVNFHNIWVGVTMEPQDTDANAQLTWVLYVQRAGFAAPLFTDGNLNAETFNGTIIACGVGSCSNQSPFNLLPTQIKSSRNLQAGDSLQLQLVVTGITAGLASSRVMLCAHTVRS